MPLCFVKTGLFIIRPNGTARPLSVLNKASNAGYRVRRPGQVSGCLEKASNAGYRVLDGPVRLAVASRTQAWLAAAAPESKRSVHKSPW